ncbi:MAG: hypothetical protein WC965_01975 [Thiohalomonadaceae bacterium]
MANIRIDNAQNEGITFTKVGTDLVATVTIVPPGGTVGQVLKKDSSVDYDMSWGSSAAAPAWGDITGTLSNQGDLDTALSGKAATVHTHSAADITSGTFGVDRGGTGISSFTTGNYMRASGASALEQRTAAQVLSDIGAAADNAVVKLTGAQSVGGVKTFTSSPIVPAPTTDMQAATKKYVDDAAMGGGTVWGGITGTLSDQGDLNSALAGKADVSHTHNASDINAGTLAVARGGTGAATLTSGSYIVGAGTSAVTFKTPAEVLSDIGAASSIGVVETSGDQYISGVKTFSSVPVLPASDPTIDNEATRKKYVDDGLATKAATAHTHPTSDITTGIFGVANGGTGLATITTGSFLRGNGTSAVTLSTPAEAKAAMGFDPFYVNPPGNGSYEIVFTESVTLNLGSVTQRGTGTLAYAKSTDGTNFSSATGSTSFAANDVLRLTVTAYSGYLTLAIPRTA